MSLMHVPGLLFIDVYVVDATRAAYVGDFTGTTVGLGVPAAVALLVVTVAFGIRTFQRENA